MTDVENVIDGLEMSYTYSNVDEGNTLVPQQLVLNALALLKAQEPRVMTFEEVKSASGYVIVQSRSCNILKLQLIKDGFVYDSLVVPIAVDDLWWEGYNKHWRLWTSIPTDEQREATPWN